VKARSRWGDDWRLWWLRSAVCGPCGGGCSPAWRGGLAATQPHGGHVRVAAACDAGGGS